MALAPRGAVAVLPRGGPYRIEDEPTAGRLAGWAVNPIWPLFASMFAGAWIAWPWFVLNGFALGSPTRRREVAWTLAGLLGSLALLGGLVAARRAGAVPDGAIKYGVTVLVAWRLAVAYVLYTLQTPVHELQVHFRGPTRDGLLVVIAATFVPWDRLLGGWQSLFDLVFR